MFRKPPAYAYAPLLSFSTGPIRDGPNKKLQPVEKEEKVYRIRLASFSLVWRRRSVVPILKIAISTVLLSPRIRFIFLSAEDGNSRRFRLLHSILHFSRKLTSIRSMDRYRFEKLTEIFGPVEN